MPDDSYLVKQENSLCFFHLLDPWVGNGLATAAAKLLQSCLTLCNPVDGSPPGSPVPGILQARTLEWVVKKKCLE